MAMAIAELHTKAGNDRRITADASILGAVAQPHLVGVWESWSPDYAANPLKTAPDYAHEKASRFKGWLVSRDLNATTAQQSWASGQPPTDAIHLFTASYDGFDIHAPLIHSSDGGYSWAITQENTKAKVNVGGPEAVDPNSSNSALQAQRRPNVALSNFLKQPDSDWNRRASTVVSMAQISLDKELAANGKPPSSIGTSFTTHSVGLITDVVKGGFKVDLSLGFELSDDEFSAQSWNSVKNPFRSEAESLTVTIPSTYRNQRPLFSTLQNDAVIRERSDFNILGKFLAHRFYSAGVPTFDHLRSFYRIPHHLYGSQPTVAARWPDHIATSSESIDTTEHPSPSLLPPGDHSTLSILPVLNRAVFMFSATLGPSDDVRINVTPLIVLWNPYNVKLEMEGAVAFPWMDFPIAFQWTFNPGNRKPDAQGLSAPMGYPTVGGRSASPYFLCEMTENGDGDLNTPIQFEPGELRVFAPSSNVPTDFNSLDYNTVRIPMRAVNNAAQFSDGGGISVPMHPKGDVKWVMKNTERVNILVRDLRGSETATSRWPYHVNLEGASRIRTPSRTTRGKAVSEIQIKDFASDLYKIELNNVGYSSLKNRRQPIAVLETLQNVTTTPIQGQKVTSPLYTTDSRQISINPRLAAGSFTVASHYNTSLRQVASFDGTVQISPGARKNAYWGASFSPSSDGKEVLPYFEIPRQPLLSLAGLQHADLASSTFATSYQFANSWASPYLARNIVAKLEKSKIAAGVPIYDSSYLSNEALWDGFFFSGLSPVVKPGLGGTSATSWSSSTANTIRTLETVLHDFIESPTDNPLPNSRIRLNRLGISDQNLYDKLSSPEGCTLAASHLYIDGAFNINSTDLDAWTAVLSGLRGQAFEINGSETHSEASTAFPRFRYPMGKKEDIWNGFRTLSDDQIRSLSTSLVDEIKKRGPFLSLGEFINRRVEDTPLGDKGAVQAAIDANNLNSITIQRPFSISEYPADARAHIINDTGVGIPGYLTQADVLQSLAPVITCRSDCFKIRAYGDAKDKAGNIVSRAWCEAVVQRSPEYTDSSEIPETAVPTSQINKKFGRRFEIVSFRMITPSELN